MSYNDIFLKRNSVKIPTLVFLLIVSFISFFLIRMLSTKPLVSRASKKNLRKIMVVNPSYNQAGIFWQTDKKEIGWLVYGEREDKTDKIVFDERDTNDKKNPYFNHYVLIRGLEQNHDYFFKVISDKQVVANIDSKSFSFHTPSIISASSNISPAYGKVMAVNGTSQTSGVVIIGFKNSYPLLTLVKLTGEWLVPLNNVIDKTTQKLRNLENNEVASIEIYGEEGEKSSIEAVVENLSPLPQTTVMGKNYSFVSKDNVLAAADSITNVNKKIMIIFPKEASIIPGESPLIKGLAIPGAEVTVIIHSDVTYSTRVQADKDGVWQVVAKERLSPGEHSLTVITKDEKGEEIKLTRQFTIAKSGEQVLGDATPEPTLTGQPVATESPTPADLTPTTPRSGFNPAPLTAVSSVLIVIGLGIILAF